MREFLKNSQKKNANKCINRHDDLCNIIYIITFTTTWIMRNLYNVVFDWSISGAFERLFHRT